MVYADEMYYIENYTGIEYPNIKNALKKSSRHIDSLTYSRIKDTGFDKLTPFQQCIVKEVTCELANFEYENAEIIESMISSYKIGEVSMSFGESWNVQRIKGVAIPAELFETLSQTGLTCRNMRW